MILFNNINVLKSTITILKLLQRVLKQTELVTRLYLNIYTTRSIVKFKQQLSFIVS